MEILAVLVYLILGIGTFSMSKHFSDKKERPIEVLTVILFWPLLLLIIGVFTLFTGSRY